MGRTSSISTRTGSRFHAFACAVAVALALVSSALASPASPSSAASVADRATPRCDNCGVADLRLEGSVDPAQAAVGDSITWRLTVNDYNTGPALDVWVDISLPTSVALVSSSTDRGTGCTAVADNKLHCYLDWLADTAQFGHVIIVTKVTATGDHVLTATTGYSGPAGPVADPNPADNTLTLTSTTPSPAPPPAPPITIALPVIGPASITPDPIAGKRVTVNFRVTDGDTGTLLAQATMSCRVSIAGKSIPYSGQYKNGVARISFVIPNGAKGKTLKVWVTIDDASSSADKAVSYRVR